jgi:hypothetical protein
MIHRDAKSWVHGLPLFILGAGLSLSGCGGDEDTLSAFNITIKTVESCREVGSGAEQCDDPEALAEVSQKGVWILDDRSSATFVLSTEDGRVLPGIKGAPDAGEGTRYVARSRRQETDAQTQCADFEDLIVDLILNEEKIEGEIFQQTYHGDVALLEGRALPNNPDCPNPTVANTTMSVKGSLRDETVVAREAFGEGEES